MRQIYLTTVGVRPKPE